MKFLTHSNEILNESPNNSKALSSRKTSMMGWTIGLKKAYPKGLIFCNKNISSSFIFGLPSDSAMFYFVIVKVLFLFFNFWLEISI
jgi:hypothetical protein